MKIERHEKSVMGGGSSESSENSGCGLFRRRAMGGGIALSRKGKENNLLLEKFSGSNTLVIRFHWTLGWLGLVCPFQVILLRGYDNLNHRVID